MSYERRKWSLQLEPKSKSWVKVKVLIYAPVLTSIFTPKFRGMQQQNPPNKTFDQTKDETIN